MFDQQSQIRFMSLTGSNHERGVTTFIDSIYVQTLINQQPYDCLIFQRCSFVYHAVYAITRTGIYPARSAADNQLVATPCSTRSVTVWVSKAQAVSFKTS